MLRSSDSELFEFLDHLGIQAGDQDLRPYRPAYPKSP